MRTRVIEQQSSAWEQMAIATHVPRLREQANRVHVIAQSQTFVNQRVRMTMCLQKFLLPIERGEDENL